MVSSIAAAVPYTGSATSDVGVDILGARPAATGRTRARCQTAGRSGRGSGECDHPRQLFVHLLWTQFFRRGIDSRRCSLHQARFSSLPSTLMMMPLRPASASSPTSHAPRSSATNTPSRHLALRIGAPELVPAVARLCRGRSVKGGRSTNTVPRRAAVPGSGRELEGSRARVARSSVRWRTARLNYEGPVISYYGATPGTRTVTERPNRRFEGEPPSERTS
jgi:hypothetical protein